MQAIAEDVLIDIVWSISYVLVMTMIPAKMAELIMMLFEGNLKWAQRTVC